MVGNSETADEPKWWRKDDDEFNVAMTNLEVARILNGKACAEVERLRGLPAAFVIASLDRIVREINDPRVFSSERDGLRIASVILRNTADEMGVKYG